ncbi:RpiR family transcriptional regulator [Lactobacillus sp. CBA3606]|uniref:MurR/RpiR family transcriptional regulator n=1 Tax=Lactobacillus sp. CBA3606 TaxID=2099789 RepID=UPI000CFB57B3|nr:MurR/RpiR family transcriptional regulator [Lactobacillus sp. CBA3606]AVK63506.1 RpiR family transcriptional regulator [Lactobacillus sp. CBA3606]
MLILTALTKQADFTTTEKRIADYILQNLATVTTGFIKDLATATYTSHSAIIRLAQKLGYRGFRDFQRALTTAAAAQTHAPVDANFPFDATDSTQAIAQKMATLTITAIQSALAQLDVTTLTTLAQQLNTAERIFLFAEGDSQLRARSFQNKLVKINKFAIIADEYHDEAWNAANLTTHDWAFFISYAGTIKTQCQFARYFQAHQIPSIVLTGNHHSPLIPLTTHHLITAQNETDFAKVGTFASQAAFEYLLDTLFAKMYAQNFHQHLTQLQQAQGLMQAGPLTTK